jgi:hypothetical protein
MPRPIRLTACRSCAGGRVTAAGIAAGHENRLLFSAAGLSLTYVWFKSGYPLPRHSHDVDCLYYIVGGALRLGSETLGKGDGFLIGAGVPYTYTPGPEGVEVLEFRASDAFDITVLANNPAFWDRALKTVTERHDAWTDEPRPSATGENAR